MKRIIKETIDENHVLWIKNILYILKIHYDKKSISMTNKGYVIRLKNSSISRKKLSALIMIPFFKRLISIDNSITINLKPGMYLLFDDLNNVFFKGQDLD